MGRVALHGRENWQTESGPRGKSGTAEKDLIEALKRNLDPETYEVDAHPKDFKHLYENVELSSKTLSEIFNPDALAMKQSKALGWGITPDFAIRNKKTGKILFGEIKRQDGWVEGKSPSAGRGNAHERLCKLFTPGIIKKYREVSGPDDKSNFTLECLGIGNQSISYSFYFFAMFLYESLLIAFWTSIFQ